jgi:hypothetical protein
MSDEAPASVMSSSDEDVLLVQEVHDEHVLPVWEPTGHSSVDEALELLQGLSGDVHDHALVYDEVHRRLRDALASQES